jgi:hypothetical protein
MILLELDGLSNAMEADVVSLGNLLVIEPGRIRIRPLPQ